MPRWKKALSTSSSEVAACSGDMTWREMMWLTVGESSRTRASSSGKAVEAEGVACTVYVRNGELWQYKYSGAGTTK